MSRRGDINDPGILTAAGTSLLTDPVPVMRDGVARLGDTLADLRERATVGLAALPPALRDPTRPATAPYPVRLSPALRDLAAGLG